MTTSVKLYSIHLLLALRALLERCFKDGLKAAHQSLQEAYLNTVECCTEAVYMTFMNGAYLFLLVTHVKT